MRAYKGSSWSKSYIYQFLPSSPYDSIQKFHYLLPSNESQNALRYFRAIKRNLNLVYFKVITNDHFIFIVCDRPLFLRLKKDKLRLIYILSLYICVYVRICICTYLHLSTLYSLQPVRCCKRLYSTLIAGFCMGIAKCGVL